MYFLIAFYQGIVELWCHATHFPNAPRIRGAFEKFGAHVQRILKMNRVYTLAEISSKIFVKNEGKLKTLFTIMVWQINELVPTEFLLKYIMRLLLLRLTPLHSKNVDY